MRNYQKFQSPKLLHSAWNRDGKSVEGIKVDFEVLNTGPAGKLEITVSLTTPDNKWLPKN